jgi:hypothetical protein
MMAVRTYSASAGEDTRSDQERMAGVRDVLFSATLAAAALAARKKVAITRGISKDIRNAKLEGRYEKFLSANAKSATAPAGTKRSSLRQQAMASVSNPAGKTWDYIQDIFRPFPKGQELLHIANQQSRNGIYVASQFSDLNIGERSFLGTLFKGPQIVAFSPGVTTGFKGATNVGHSGGMLINGNLHITQYDAATRKHVRKMIPGVHVGLTSRWGAHAERSKRGLIKLFSPRTTEEFIRKVDLDSDIVLEAQEKILIERYLHKLPGFSGVTRGKTIEELRAMADEAHAIAYPLINGGITYGGPRYVHPYKHFLRQKVEAHFPQESILPGMRTTRDNLTIGRKLREDAADARRRIARDAAKTPLAKARFKAFQISEKIGVGEQYTKFGGGFPQKVERWVREGAGVGYHHPDSGELLSFEPRRYNRKGRTLGSNVRGQEGPWYITNAEDSVKRWASMLSSGTFHRVGEKAFGIGVTSRANVFTEFARKAVGAESGSWADYWIRGVGQTGRALAIGVGVSYTYRFMNYLSRQSIGWGPTDVAAATYVNAREFQQKVLHAVGITHMARAMENAFPGSVTSPAAHALRMLSPLIISEFMRKRGGPRGYLRGLAMGVAIALVTWGDITQSPEELHRIFTGEQEIPVRKGRYWLLGKTPFFGGKIAYWRPHWYPMMKSGYQNQGQLWDSETEYWAQGTALSPILAPILTGKMWDPYYWEKKHAEDRPYPISGELFEPTMPFAWLGNLTIGKIIKPPVMMHNEYLGNSQTNASSRDRGLPEGTSERLRLSDMSGVGIDKADSPHSLGYQLGLAAYAQTEQMGMTGFLTNTMWGKLTGQQDFMGSQSILQSSRRATGYERAYWEKELGDPGAGLDEGVTEYFRRFLPHRRTNVDEYNPIPNQMPDWLPGEDYFINFRQGDPYVKIPYGEARLPGRGYESLHELHSGIPGVYDAVDRLMILANVAPYSDEYKHYKVLAKGMVKDDAEWSTKVQNRIAQREALNNEYEFLSLGTDNVPAGLKTASSIYRNALAAATNFPNPLEMIPDKVIVGVIPTHINKWLPYKTPESAYEDFRLYGSEYAMWDQPFEGFIFPFVRKVRSTINPSYVPQVVEDRRDIQEYFDKLKYVKYSNLSRIARMQGDMDLASKLSRISRKTMAAGNYHPAAAMMSVPKEERAFFREFSGESGYGRDRVLAMTPEYMHNYYKRAWNANDGESTYSIDYKSSEDLVGYFKNHYLPPAEWSGWHPDVGLEQVKLRVVKNEAFDIHKFNLWESNERQLARQPFVPLIEDINAPSNDLTMLQNVIHTNMENFGMTNNRVFVSRTPADKNTHNIRISIKQDTSDNNSAAMQDVLASMR